MQIPLAKVIKITLKDWRHKTEDSIERGFFACRWILAPMYIILMVVLVVILIKFVGDLISFIYNIFIYHSDTWITEILDLLDLTLIANLVLIVAFSGYENFISRMDYAHERSSDTLSWMGSLDFSGLKLKIIGSVVAISTIELLKDFFSIAVINPNVEFWRVVLHVIFVITGVVFARMEMIEAKKSHMTSKEELIELEKEKLENL